MMTEFDAKLEMTRALVEEKWLDALLLQRVSSFAWLTCGAPSYVDTADSLGVASLLITAQSHYLLTNNIEVERFQRELELAGQGWEFLVAPWYQADERVELLTRGLRLGADVFRPVAQNLQQELGRLRINLLPEEQERFAVVCRKSAEAMDRAIRRVRPGMTEFEIAGLLAGEAQRRGILPIVNLVATDGRVWAYRHHCRREKRWRVMR